jgi:hypothetical protein
MVFVINKYYIYIRNMGEKQAISGKLIGLLKTFSEKEFKEFGLFINSPFFTKEAAQGKLYLILKKYYPAFDGRDFKKEKVFSKLYPDKKYNDGILRNVFTRTLALAEDYLTVKRYSEKEFYYRLNLLSELNERKQLKLFEKEIIVTENYLQENLIEDGNHYYEKFLLQEEQRSFTRGQKSSLKSGEMYPGLFHNFSISFMINMLKIDVYMQNTNRYMFHFEQYKFLMEGIEKHIEDNYAEYSKITYLNYYYNASMLAKTSGEEYYYNLFKLIKHKDRELAYTDKRGLYVILANYCYTKSNAGELNFLKETI